MTLTAIQAASASTTILSIASKAGVVDQLRRGRRTADRVTSPLRESTSAASYLSWTVYGLLAADWVVVVNQAIGVAVCGALLIQALTRTPVAEEIR